MLVAERRTNTPDASARDHVVRVVQEVLSVPDAGIDYAQAKISLDAIVDPGSDSDWTFAELDRLTHAAHRLAGARPSELDRLHAVRTMIYRAGPWNGGRPFDYDHGGFKQLKVKLLSNYLESRRGNCVSMPILFLILADRMGLDVSLAMARAHLFIRWRDAQGRVLNLETTSGANPARDVWIKEAVGFTERGVASGFYMRSLSRRESVAAMALTVVEHLMAARRFREALAVTELIVRANPREGMAWANQSAACYDILRSEFLDRYRSQLLIPLPRRAEYLLLLQRNHQARATAIRLGWEPI